MKTFTYTTRCKTILGDLHTPVSTYLKVRDIFPQSALMESSDYHGSENNRSFIGLNPVASIGINHGTATATYPDGSIEEHPISEHFRADHAISDFLNRFKVSGEYNNYCGLYGYTTFNAVRYFEHINVKDSRDPKNDAPDMLYILYKYLIVFNDFRNEMLLLEMLQDGEDSHLDYVEKAIHNRNYTTYDFRAVGETTSTLTDEEHKANIRKGIAHCMRGDVFQIVLSRRFIQRYEGDDFKLYRALRSINPSPYLFYFDFGGFRIFGSSPETHCKIENGRATIDPIAGTTRRNGDKKIDAELTANLLADPKENAEHVMLVDLARNDLSRNCHDVQVEFYKEAPDFVNAPPKLRFVARYVEKWFHCEVLLRQEECLSEVSPVFRHPYPDCRDSFGCLKHLIDTHPNLVNGNESLQFLIYLIGDEANADMCLYPTFCKMKHRTHFQSSF